MFINNEAGESFARNPTKPNPPIPVNFRELRIDYVIAPSQFNAGKCIGNCDSEYLHSVTVTGELQKPNNYARLLASQAYMIVILVVSFLIIV